ncbi:hypothetical protein C8A05DRAFT_19856 [Staphylotrichum tortipilum]|uniref:NodB homology domain-containing protein n=1 Tax=Staphylotrichum tortipilum TaxID=2831512 RepID=A0AAN6MAJ6_9PEZI|nr:hypothetical protein C8A05DRAFT_19856 [Staphylotrichum longicolle]
MPRWPPPYKAALSLTMDNLGEAQSVLHGTWPHAIGSDPAITTTLPRMLSLLANHSVRATYFAEAWSLPVYPSAVQSLVSGGHEVAWHGYQHEVWSGLREGEEEENFRQSWEVANNEGVRYQGFRPPGGRVNERTWGLLREHGMGYVSPLGKLGVGKERVVVLPFEWRAVDAFWYMEKFAGIRREHGEGEGVLGPKEFGSWLMARVDEVVRTGGYMSVLFHPFLQTSEERLAVMEEVVKRIAEDGEIWVAPCREVAEWVRAHPDEFGSTDTL